MICVLLVVATSLSLSSGLMWGCPLFLVTQSSLMWQLNKLATKLWIEVWSCGAELAVTTTSCVHIHGCGHLRWSSSVGCTECNTWWCSRDGVGMCSSETSRRELGRKVTWLGLVWWRVSVCVVSVCTYAWQDTELNYIYLLFLYTTFLFQLFLQPCVSFLCCDDIVQCMFTCNLLYFFCFAFYFFHILVILLLNCII